MLQDVDVSIIIWESLIENFREGLLTLDWSLSD
jgi:hypothetical protein